MRCPTLKDLPSPPKGKTGWPWTEENLPIPDKMPNGLLWPQITAVTPSYNQKEFIEKTIRSVLLQGYPNIEYIIIDGNSTDGSVDIIRKYTQWLTYWISEPDRGQSHALNKGFKRAKGEIIAWINSDDAYLPGAFNVVGQELDEDKGRYIIYGDFIDTDEEGQLIRRHNAPALVNRMSLIRWWIGPDYQSQPATFFLKKVFNDIDMLDESLNYTMDVDFWIRAAEKYTFHRVPFVFCDRCRQRKSKNIAQYIKVLQELIYMGKKKHWGSKLSLDYYKNLISFFIYGRWVYLNIAHHSLDKNRLAALKYSIFSIISFPINIFRRDHFSVFLRAIFGNVLIEKFIYWWRSIKVRKKI